MDTNIVSPFKRIPNFFNVDKYSMKGFFKMVSIHIFKE